jgi:hypothetical protein
MPIEVVQEIVDVTLAKTVRAVGLDDDAGPAVAVVPPDQLELRATHHLGFVPEEFDIGRRCRLPINRLARFR